MNNINCQNGPTSFDSGAVPVTSSSVWVSVANLLLPLSQGGVLIRIEVGAGGALGGFKLTRAAAHGRSHLDWMTSNDINMTQRESLSTYDVSRVVMSSGNDIATLPASGAADIMIVNQKGVAEIGVWALKASADTTVQAYGAVTA